VNGVGGGIAISDKVCLIKIGHNLILSALILASAFQTASAQLMIQWSINGQPAVSSLNVPQEILNEGDTCVMTFANLPYVGVLEVNVIPAQAGLSFSFDSNDKPSAHKFRVEAFEVLNPIATWTHDFNIFFDIDYGSWGFGGGFWDAWQDNQGVVKFTMMEGSLSMTGMILSVRTYDSHYQFHALPVPEPSSLSLLALGGVVVALGRRR